MSRRRSRPSELAFTLSAPEYRERVAKLAALGALAQGPAITAAVRAVARETGFTQRDVRAVFVAAIHAHARRDAERRRAEKDAHLERERVAGEAAVARGLRGPAASAAALAGALFAGLPVVTPGVERVARCKFCDVASTADLRGLHGWTVLRGQDVCPKCSPHFEVHVHVGARWSPPLVSREAAEAWAERHSLGSAFTIHARNAGLKR